MAEKVLGYLERHYMPDLRSTIVTQRIFTPLDFKVELNAHLGSAFSLEPKLLAERLFPGAQSRPTYAWTLLCRSGNTSGGGNPRCCKFGEGNG